MSMLSKRVRSINPSPTLAITAEAKRMKAQGIDVVGFGAGEPDFDTPDHIKEAAKKALDRGFTKYTPASDQVLISCGAKHSIFNAILALCDEGDEVILPSPYWVSYPEMIKLAQAKPVIIKTTQENSFKITSQQLEEAISSKTKLFILNSPSNPTGMIYTKDELRIISDILTEARLNPRIKELTILVNGVSKTYSMTGWRIGYAVGPKEIIQAMSNLQSHSTSNPTSVSQVAAIAALQGSQEEVRRMVDEFQRRRDHIVKRLNRIPGISCLKPQGAFYAFPDISRIIGKSCNEKIIRDSISLAHLLLYEAKVAVVPGASFGADEHLRFSYATSMENIDKGLDRVEEFVKKLP